MARTKDYSHFCPVARSLEVIGEKWSLLVVRDLLRGPQRFTDLHRYLGGITPKWLSARLRELESAGIVERDQVPGRREVWYRLSDKGRELAPVVSALAVWGFDHAMRAPLPGEVAYIEQVMTALTTYLIRKRVRPEKPVTWQFRFDDQPAHHIAWDGFRWRTARGAYEGEPAAEVVVSGTWDHFVDLIVAEPPQREPLLDTLPLAGDTNDVERFRDVMLRRGRVLARAT